MPVIRSIHSRNAALARLHRHHLYSTPAHRAWRARILLLARYRCAICGAKATIADHHPHTLAELLAAGTDPWPIDGGRALCHTCSGRADGGRS